MNSCEESQSADLVRYAYGELDTANVSRLREHVEHCAECTCLIAEYEALRAATADAGQQTISPELWPAIASQIAERPQPETAAKRHDRRRRQFTPVGYGLLLAASIVAAAVLIRGTRDENAGTSQEVTRYAASHAELNVDSTAQRLAESQQQILMRALTDAERAVSGAPDDESRQLVARIRADQRRYAALADSIVELVR